MPDTERDFDLYENEDGTCYAVLIHLGYGGNWAFDDVQSACDKRIVEFWLAHKDDEAFMEEAGRFSRHFNDEAERDNPVFAEYERFFKSIGWGYWESERYKKFNEPLPDGFVDTWNPPRIGAFDSLELEWVPYGEHWRVEEYDGAEEIVFHDPIPRGYYCFTKDGNTPETAENDTPARRKYCVTFSGEASCGGYVWLSDEELKVAERVLGLHGAWEDEWDEDYAPSVWLTAAEEEPDDEEP